MPDIALLPPVTLPCCPLPRLAAVGTMTVRAADLNVTCLPVSPAAASGSGSDSGSSGGGVPAYVWAIVGVVAAAVVAAAITAALLVRRRRLRRAGSVVGLPKDPERAEEAADGAPQAGAPPQEDDSPCNSPGASTELQDGLWRSRSALGGRAPFWSCLVACTAVWTAVLWSVVPCTAFHKRAMAGVDRLLRPGLLAGD